MTIAMTSLMLTYLDARRDQVNEAIKEMRKERVPQEEREAGYASLLMIETSLTSAIILKNTREDEEEITHTQLTEEDMNILPADTWLEPARPLQIATVPFEIAAFFLSCSGQAKTIQRAKEQFPQIARVLDRLRPYEYRWMIDIIDSTGEVVYGFLFWSHNNTWIAALEKELCPWQRCKENLDGTVQECLQCRKLRHQLTAYLCLALKVHHRPTQQTHPQKKLLLERYRARRTADLAQEISHYSAIGDLQERRKASLLQQLLIVILDKAKKIYIDEPTSREIARLQSDIINKRREVPEGFYQQPTATLDSPLWVECEIPSTIKGFPFLIQGFLFAQSGGPQIQEALTHILGYRPEVLDHPQFDSAMWGVDIIDEQARTIFNFIWTGKTWQTNMSHECPWNECGLTRQGGKSCQKCQATYKYCAMWITTILLARTGYFQEISFEERSTRNKRSTLQTPQQKQQSMPEEEEVQYTFVSMNITKKKVILPSQEEEHQHTPGIHWVQLHDPQDVEILKKLPRSHSRHLKSGEVIQVRPVKERTYWRLRNRPNIFEKLTSAPQQEGE